MFYWLKFLGVIPTASLLGGCWISIGEKIPTNSYCFIAKPITWADTDTLKTIDQVYAHKRVFVGLCVDKK